MQTENTSEFTDRPALDALADFLQIVRRLRLECPWDREQTHESLRPMLIEEAYETVEAIEQGVATGDYTELKKELGDLLLHILFHSELAREEGQFTLKDVIETESEKLIYRHPHVFGDTKVTGAEQVAQNWEQLKRREKGRNSVLDGIPKSLPALQKAQRTQERAAKVGFDWPDSQSVWEKVREEVFEFEEELRGPSSVDRGPSSVDRGPSSVDRGPSSVDRDPSSVDSDPSSEEANRERAESDEGGRATDHVLANARKQEEFGDILFSLVNLARHEKIDPEHSLRQATQKFERRFRAVEVEVEQSGRPMSGFSLEELDAIWDRVKAIE